MKIGTFYICEDEGTLHPTGEKTTITAAQAADAIEDLVICLMGDVGRYEDPDWHGAVHSLTKIGVVDENYVHDDQDWV